MRTCFLFPSGVWTLIELASQEESEGRVSISTEEESLHEFIVGFKIETWREIDQLHKPISFFMLSDNDKSQIIKYHNINPR